MICKQIPIEAEGETGRLETYFLNNSVSIDPERTRPVVLICPGGSYEKTSDREAEGVAIRMCARGFHACVLRYSVAPVRYPAALIQLAKSVAWLREHSGEYHMDPKKIVLCGFSAGGHLAASLGVFWNHGLLREKTGLSGEEIRPDRLMLCYPVISSGAFAHRGSFENLLGRDSTEEEWREQSLELWVNRDTPPSFLWHTVTDETVPVENSMLFAFALRKAGVNFEMHLYPKGGHGLSLGTEETRSSDGRGVEPAVQSWIELAGDWILRWQEESRGKSVR